jgi:iron complex transport system permease protein
MLGRLRKDGSLGTSFPLVLWLAPLVLLTVLACGLCCGLVPISPSRALAALWGAPGSEATRLVLLHVRLPRLIVAWLVGSALSVAGCALQGVFRNPLADPAVLGVSASAALCAQGVLLVAAGAQAALWLPPAACAGAALATVLLLVMVDRDHRGGVETLTLAGIALGQLALAASSLLLSFALADYTVAERLLRWALGSLDGRSWVHVAWGTAPILVGSAWVLGRARQLDALMLGDATAAALGVPVGRLRRELVLAVALLSGITVAIGGVIGFVGLVVPHAMRRCVGAAHRRLVPAVWLAGGASLVVADTIARLAIAPRELQLGVVTGAIGTPCFVLLLNRRLRQVTR